MRLKLKDYQRFFFTCVYVVAWSLVHSIIWINWLIIQNSQLSQQVAVTPAGNTHHSRNLTCKHTKTKMAAGFASGLRRKNISQRWRRQTDGEDDRPPVSVCFCRTETHTSERMCESLEVPVRRQFVHQYGPLQWDGLSRRGRLIGQHVCFQYEKIRCY